MAAHNNTITITGAEYRPCYVDGKKALFHRWVDCRKIVEPSVLKGGHGGGVIARTFGIVEYADGTVAEVAPSTIRFDDDKLSDYAFSQGHEKGCEGVGNEF